MASAEAATLLPSKDNVDDTKTTLLINSVQEVTADAKQNKEVVLPSDQDGVAGLSQAVTDTTTVVAVEDSEMKADDNIGQNQEDNISQKQEDNISSNQEDNIGQSKEDNISRDNVGQSQEDNISLDNVGQSQEDNIGQDNVGLSQEDNIGQSQEEEDTSNSTMQIPEQEGQVGGNEVIDNQPQKESGDDGNDTISEQPAEMSTDALPATEVAGLVSSPDSAANTEGVTGSAAQVGEIVADKDRSEVATVTTIDDEGQEQVEERSIEQQLENEINQLGTENIDVPTSSSAADAAAALQALAAQTSGMTAPEAIAHLQQVLQVPSHVVSSLVSEVASEVIVMAQALHAQNVIDELGQVSGDTVVEDPEEAVDQTEVITLSSNQCEEEGDGSAEGEVIVPTSSSAADAAAALQALASQTSGMSAPEAIAHLQQVLQVPSHVVSSLVSEVASEVIVMAQAVQNTTEAMESMIKDETVESMMKDDQSDSSEETVGDIKKTKSGMLKIHKCPECNKGFSLRSTLSKHLQRHTSETKCTQCDKMFFSPVKLATHIRTHHTPTEKVKDVLCPECGKGFYNHAKLRVHLRTHTGERPFPCAFCEKRFVCTSHRKRHERLHTGEHPFVCDTCGKGFGSPSNLKDHTYTHTKENPYPCNICGKGFTQWGAMMRHIAAIHEKRKDVKCPHCNKCFARKDYLKLHIQKCHWNKCPNCKDTFESDEIFESHKSECTGSPSATPKTTPRSTARIPAKRKAPSSASPRKGTPGKSPLLTPIRKKPRKSPSVVPPVSRRKRNDPAHVDQLLSIYEQFEDDPLADPEYKAEDGDVEEGDMVEELMEEEGEVEEIVEEEGVGLDQEEILVQEVHEEVHEEMQTEN